MESLATEGLHLQVGVVCRHGEYPQSVGVAETTLPALHSDDRCTRRDDFEVERRAETVADTVVDLRASSYISHLRLIYFHVCYSHRSAIGGSRCHEALDTRPDKLPGEGESGAQFAGCG